MKKLIFAILAICLFVFMGCNKTDINERVGSFRKSVKYFKDYRSNICFATNCWDFGHCENLTAVPCTEKVMKLIVNKREGN